MWTNYLKIAFRNIKRQRLLSGISILGLGLGFYCFLLLGFYISSEKNYDRTHSRVFRLLQHIQEEEGAERAVAATGPQVGLAGAEQFPEVERATQLLVLGRLTVGNDPANRYYERISVVDSNFFEVFDFSLLEGSSASLFSSSNAILTDQFQRFYEEDILRGRLLGFFSGVAILIACLGLFVMVAHTLKQRTKEIGIRKVLGASVAGIVGLVTRDFLRIIALAFLAGLPLAWLAMHYWLQEFAYRAGLAWWAFGLAAGVALLIAFITISLQSIRAASANPVEALRYE